MKLAGVDAAVLCPDCSGFGWNEFHSYDLGGVLHWTEECSTCDASGRLQAQTGLKARVLKAQP